MRKSSNLSVRTRILGSVIITLLLTVVIAALAIFGVSSTQGEYLSVIQGPVAISDNVQDTELQVNIIARHLRDMALFGYDSGTVAEIQTSLDNLDASLSALDTAYTDTDGMDTAYLDAIDAWRNAFSEIDAALQQNDLDRARSLIENQCTPLLDQVVTAGNALMDQVRSEGDAQAARAASDVTLIRVIVIVLTILVVLACLFLNLRMVRIILRPLKEAEEAVSAFSQGDLSYTVSYSADNEIGNLCGAVRTSQQIVNNIIGDITRITKALEAGDLTVTTTVDYPGQFAPIRDNLEELMDHLSGTMSKIINASDQVAAGADQVSVGSQSLAQGATEQASAVEELSATINEIDAAAQRSADQARASVEKSNVAAEQVNVCNNRLRDMRKAMDDILASQSNISKIIETMENIAFQTNILALNAAVEAARAGSAGKGFAVVADEVRNLASKSDQAAKQTKELIESSLSYVERGNELVEDVDANMQKTVALASEAIQMMDQVAQDSINQASSINQLTTGVDQISAVVQTNSATSEESAAASQELSSQSTVMKQLVQQFKLRTDTPSDIPADTSVHQPDSTPPALSSGGGAPSAENRFNKY